MQECGSTSTEMICFLDGTPTGAIPSRQHGIAFKLPLERMLGSLPHRINLAVQADGSGMITEPVLPVKFVVQQLLAISERDLPISLLPAAVLAHT